MATLTRRNIEDLFLEFASVVDINDPDPRVQSTITRASDLETRLGRGESIRNLQAELLQDRDVYAAVLGSEFRNYDNIFGQPRVQQPTPRLPLNAPPSGNGPATTGAVPPPLAPPRPAPRSMSRTSMVGWGVGVLAAVATVLTVGWKLVSAVYRAVGGFAGVGAATTLVGVGALAVWAGRKYPKTAGAVAGLLSLTFVGDALVNKGQLRHEAWASWKGNFKSAQTFEEAMKQAQDIKDKPNIDFSRPKAKAAPAVTYPDVDFSKGPRTPAVTLPEAAPATNPASEPKPDIDFSKGPRNGYIDMGTLPNGKPFYEVKGTFTQIHALKSAKPIAKADGADKAAIENNGERGFKERLSSNRTAPTRVASAEESRNNLAIETGKA